MECTECNKIIYKTVKYKWEEYVKSFMCCKCNMYFCWKHIYSYVDESNSSITSNSPQLCRWCYIINYK